MKKLLAIVLTIAMLMSTCVGLAFTTGAANTSKACLLNGGYIQPDLPASISDTTGGAYAVSFDAWLVDSSSILYLWADSASTRYAVAATYVGATVQGSASGYSANDVAAITWGDVGLTGTMHHFKLILNNGYDAIEMDGAEVWRGTSTANSYWTGDIQIFNTAGGGVAVDNFAITSVDESKVVYSDDFESGTGIFSSMSQTDVVLPKVETVKTNGLFLNSGYIEIALDNEVGSSYSLEFDLWLADATSGINFWADGASSRLTVTGTYVGMWKAGGASAYTADDYVSYSWGDAVGYASAAWHHIKMDFGVNGSDNIYIDGTLVYQSGKTCNSYFTGTTQIAGTTGNGVAIDNFVATNNSKETFEDGSTGSFGSGSVGELVYVDGDAETVTTKGLLLTSTYLQFDTPNDVGSAYAIEFDLWLADATSGIQFWADYASSRLTLTGTYAGMERAGGASAYANNDFVSFDWGTPIGFASAGWHHVKMEFGVNGSDNIYVDGLTVYHSGQTCDLYWTGTTQIATAIGNGVAIDNFAISNNSVVTFEEGTVNPYNSIGSSIDLIVEGDEVVCRNHTEGTGEVTVEPTCYSGGEMTYKCVICGKVVRTEAIEKLEHPWGNFRDGKVIKAATATEDGVLAIYCTGGCNLYRTISIPATEKYTGTLRYFLDFEDAIATQTCADFFNGVDVDNDVPTGIKQLVEDGVGIQPVNCAQTYWQFHTGTGDSADYSVSIDIKIDSTYTMADDGNGKINWGYGHTLYFSFGGQDGLGNRAGYDFDRGCYFIRPETGNAYDEITLYEDFNFGEWQTLTLRFHVPGEEAYDEDDESTWSWCSLEINGETKVIYDDEFAYYDLDSEKDYIVIRDCGVAGEVDNFAVGSYDFDWVREEEEPEVTVGDVDGNGRVNALDIFYLLKIVSGKVAPDFTYDKEQADINGDDRINTSDVLALKKLLVIAE